MNVVALSGFEYAEGTYEYVAIIEALLKEEYAVNYELVDGNGTIAKFESSLIWSVERPTIVDDSFTASIESDDIREYYNPNMSYTLTVVVDPTREGYTFEWYKDSLPISYDTQSIVVSTVNDSGIYYCDVSYNGKVVETNSVSVEILVNEIDVTRTRLENATLSYTGETQTVSVIVPNDIANLVTYTVSGNTGKEPGDYIATVVFTLKDSENYAFLNSRGRVELSWKIQSGSIDPTEKDPVFNFVYDVNGVYVKVDSTNGIKDADIAVNNVTSQYANFENEYGNIVFVYDITFVDVNNQKVVLGQDTFKVTLGLSGSYVGNDQLVIIYIADDNSVEKLESTVNGQYIEFTTTHFSKYAVVEPKSVTPPPSGSDSSTPDSSTDDSSTPDSSTEDSSTPDVSTEESSTPNISTDDSSSSEDVSTGPTSSDPSSSGEPGGSEPQPQTNDLWIWVLIGLALIIIALLLVLILRKKEPVVVPVAIAEATEEVSYIVVKENNVQVLALEEVQANDIVVAMPCKSHAIGSVTEGKVSIFKAPLPTNEIAEAGSYIVVNENNVDVVKVDENTILPEQPHVIGTVTEDKVSIFKEALPMKKVLGKVNEGSVVVYKQPKEALANNKPEQKVEEVVAQPAESNETVQVEVGQIEEGNDKIVIKIFKDPKVK